MRRLLHLAVLAATAPVPAQSGLDHFEAEVRPLLARRCYKCHGPDKQESDLRLDRAGGIRSGGSRGLLFVPGDPDRSLIVRAVRRTDPHLQMPPRRRLRQAEVRTLERWIADGPTLPDGETVDAPRPEAFDLEERRRHWAWQPVRDVKPPATRDPAWPAGDVDRFVLARLEDAGLRPAPEADRRVLVRRAYFDLLGLPPPPAEVERFVGDDSPFAWRNLLNRLLASPHFGERWARHWLDLVRYAESRGHEYDYVQPNAWHYRDYVIRAFNRDVPYDQLVREHVAGDLLVTPRLDPATGANESVLATGFWFLGEEVHSPVDTRIEECDRIDNKIDVFSKAFLGLTVGCARCHDHKFDAITTADYYALSGFLLSSDYRQVRFDTMAHNEQVARDLDRLGRETRARLGPALAAALRPQVDDLASHLAAGRDALAADTDSGRAPDPAFDELDHDIVFEDFEGRSYGCWQREGTAFGPRPMRAAEIASDQRRSGHHGTGLVSSHNTRSKSPRSAPDVHVGRLVSTPFVIRHPFVQFLIGGGSHRGKTCLNLVVGGRVVRSATGDRNNRMRRRSFDVRDLRGRRAWFEIIDSVTGSWGNVTVDRIVLARDASSAAFDTALRSSEIRRIRRAADELARRRGLDAERVLAAALLLTARRATRTSPAAAPSDAIDVVDYSRLREGQWLANGFTFGLGPRLAGEIHVAGSAAAPALTVRAQSAAEQDRAWDGLALAEGTQPSPSQVNWVQAGHTLRTPTFRLERKKLWYLVRGAGHALAVVDGHRLIDGPLHRRNIKVFDAGASYRWIEHDVSDYAGRRVLVELTPRAGAVPALAIARVVQGDRPPVAAAAPEIPSRARLRCAVDALAAGRVGAPDLAAARWLLDGEAPLARPLLTDPSVAGIVRDGFRSRDRVTRRIATHSRTAPALLEGTSFDSPILVRGDPKAPGSVVQRRFLQAIDPSPCSAPGSGRLALADRLLAPDNPLTARVLVNRVWHHLLGRGIVATVDNFGQMGEPPTHPDLLDWLARRFVKRGWSVKELIREIMLSRTYRMSSDARSGAPAVDPDNRLLHTMRVKRLSGELIRDAMLAVSGRLDPTMFGRSIPLHPDQYFRSVERNLPKGPLDGKFRRSIYLAVRRNCLMKLFLAFDYPLPATARGRRTVTNVPAQALALMNNPLVVRLAQHWADGLPAGGAKTRIDAMYRAAFARPPSAPELQSALAFVHGASAAGAPARTAWVDLAHVLFNVKEFIFVR